MDANAENLPTINIQTDIYAFLIHSLEILTISVLKNVKWKFFLISSRQKRRKKSLKFSSLKE